MTVYQNAKTISDCLDALIKAMTNLDYEIIIIDNFSNDGTFELLTNFSERYKNIKLFRYKCSRGLGKKVAFNLSTGEFIIPIVDPDDVIEEPTHFRLIIDSYIRSNFKGLKAMNPIYPRHVIQEVCWSNLNRAEDNEFLARLYKKNLLFSLPIPISVRRDRVQGISLRLLPVDWHREKRYAVSFHFFSRFLKNKIDMVTGAAWTLKKVIREYRFYLSWNLFEVYAATVYHLFFITLRILQNKKIFECDKKLSNYLYCHYKSLTLSVNPFELGFSEMDIKLIPKTSDSLIKYISRFYPEIREITNFVPNQ